MREQPGCVCLGVMMGVGEWYQRGGDPKARSMTLLSRGEEKQSDIHLVGLGSLCEFRLAFITGMINRLQYSICSGGEREEQNFDLSAVDQFGKRFIIYSDTHLSFLLIFYLIIYWFVIGFVYLFSCLFLFIYLFIYLLVFFFRLFIVVFIICIYI